MADPNIDVVIDCSDPETLATFWAEALGYTKAGLFDQYFVLLPTTREYPPVLLQRVPEPKTTKARVHIDLRVNDIEAEAQRLGVLGARRIDIGQGDNPGSITMADPEGNEFCVCPGVPPAARGRVGRTDLSIGIVTDRPSLTRRRAPTRRSASPCERDRTRPR